MIVMVMVISKTGVADVIVMMAIMISTARICTMMTVVALMGACNDEGVIEHRIVGNDVDCIVMLNPLSGTNGTS